MPVPQSQHARIAQNSSGRGPPHQRERVLFAFHRRHTSHILVRQYCDGTEQSNRTRAAAPSPFGAKAQRKGRSRTRRTARRRLVRRTDTGGVPRRQKIKIKTCAGQRVKGHAVPRGETFVAEMRRHASSHSHVIESARAAARRRRRSARGSAMPFTGRDCALAAAATLHLPSP
jgi:hypothetical protein